MAISHRLDEVFKFSVTLKGIDGALEIVAGVVLLVVSPTRIDGFVQNFVHHHLSRGPNDGFLGSHILKSADELAQGGRAFAAAYLLIHGIVKIVLVVALLQRRIWAYPWMIGVLILFIAYQCYRLTYKPGIGLTVITIFDAFVVWLTWREWRNAVDARPVSVATAAGPTG
jgi:uncharacterized membrane protein